MRDKGQSEVLLGWYDAHARALPWRVSPQDRKAGHRPDPYRVWLSEIMLQQTTVAAVRAYFIAFTRRWPTVNDLAAAPDADIMAAWAGLGYYARARNLLKCARVVTDDLGGHFPTNRDALITLPGIGPYTAAAIAAIAFDQPVAVVDGNVERVMARLFQVETPLPKAKPALAKLAARLTPNQRPGDYAQAVMDLGATICTPRKPACGTCPWRPDCAARANNMQAELPHRAPKTPRPIRHGIAYLARRSDGAWLLERRPDKGLLGGMLGWPGSDWGDAPAETPPIDANWHNPGTQVRHTFTHFHLRLDLRVANSSMKALPSTGQFVDRAEFRPADLPTVMRKAYDLASAALDEN